MTPFVLLINYVIFNMSNFHISETALLQRFDALKRQMGLSAQSAEELSVWQASLRIKLRDLLGIDHLTVTPPNARVTETVQCKGYRRERVEIDTEPGVTMSLYILIPDGVTHAPAVIAAHGHDSAGKLTVAGVADNPDVAARITTYDYNYGEVAAQKGYVTFCPDARGFGERRESLSQGADQLFNSSCHQLAHMALPLGLTVAGMWAWDLMRLIDYVGTRPECAGQPVACIGLSGGGLQTLYLSALDERVACAVISGYFYGVKDSLLVLSGNCDCNYVPHLWENVDMGDLAALIAPRPLLFETGRQDPLNGARGVENVLEQYEITSKAYRLSEAQTRLDIDIFEGPHKWHGAKVWAWLARYLG